MNTLERATRLRGVTKILTGNRLVPIAADAPFVERMVQGYRDKYRLGPRDCASEVGVEWQAVIVQGEPVCVFGARWLAPGHFDVTDAYCEPTRVGIAALGVGCLWFRDQWQSGAFELFTFTVLHENRTFWKAAVKAFGAPPYAMIFAFRRKAP